MKTSFFTKEELKEIGFKNLGENVLISRKSSIYSPEKISIGNNVRIDDFCILSGNITLENYIHVAAYTSLYGSSEGIKLFDFVNLSSKVSIYAISDDYSGNSMTNPMVCEKYKETIRGEVILMKHVIVGSGTVILPNVTISEGVAIGALSLVSKSLKKWGIYAGNPIKFIKEREKKLLDLEKEFLGEINE